MGIERRGLMRFRKISPRLWKDEKFILLTQTEKLISLYCLTAQTNRIGLFNFSPAQAAEDLEISSETFAKGFKKVCERLKWTFDKEYRVLFIPTWWKYNTPENPNVLTACLKDISELPKTPLLSIFFSNLAFLPETFHETFLKGLAKPSPNQEQYQDQEQEQKQKKPPAPQGESSSPKTIYTPEEFERFWNIYPHRNGIKKGRAETEKAIQEKLKPGEMPLLIKAAKKFSATPDARKGIGVKDPQRFVWSARDNVAPWREWVKDAQPSPPQKDYMQALAEKELALQEAGAHA
jgi:hypothetical protein